AQGNAILFRGTGEEARIVGELVEQVDRVSLLLARRYIAGTVLDDVLKASERLGLGPADYVSQGTGGFGGSSGFRNRQSPVNQQNLGAAGEGALHGSGFLVDEETFTFVYFGTPSQHAIVGQLVEQFREQEVKNEIVIRVYELQYARASGGGSSGGGDSGVGGGGGGASDTASGIVDVLNELIASPEANQARAPFLPESSGAALALQNAGIRPDEVDADSLFVATEDNTTIVADDANNQIIIRAPEVAHAQFEKLIQQLDKRRPQVLIEAHIVSIGVDSDFDWVTDFGLQTGSISLFSGDQTTFDTDDGGFGFPAGPDTGGLSLGLLNTDVFRFGLRTLAADGTARVSSRPEVVVNDNSTATIVREDIEPFASTDRDSAGVTTITQGGTAEAGTTLTVRPQIGAGGDIILEYSLELSAFDLSRQQANLQPPTSSDSYESIVTLPTDTTLVVGGLEFEDFSQSDSGIPLLKDIPFFGNAFKDYAQRSSRQRIYVFITPRILDDPNHGKLKLLSGSRRELAGVEGEWPELRPALIPIPTYRPLDERVLRRNFIME
ncbi:MAG: secretin N-terminal domain-containing protein, partial [Planctomycetota bacterium]